MPSPFQIGNVVEVVSAESEDFVGKQGAVVNIAAQGKYKDVPIGVRFPRLYKYLVDFDPTTTIQFAPTDLKIRPQGFSFDPKDEARHMVDGPPVIVWPKWPLIPGKTICDFQDCTKPAWFPIMMNIIGNVTRFYACKDHAHWHGCWCEETDFNPQVPDKEVRRARKLPPLTIADKTKILFGETWQVKRPLTFFIPGETKCVHAECEKRAWFQILVNCWGSVYQMDVCPQHAHLHGSRLDQVPYKPEIGKLEFVIEGQVDLHELATA